MTATKSIQLPANGFNASGTFYRWPEISRFASIVRAAFAGVAVLPNATVLAECIRATGKNLTRTVDLAVIEDTADFTTYQINGGWAYKIDAVTGETEELDLR